MKKILIIEDSSFQRKILSTILQTTNASLIFADNGKDGMDLVGTGKPDMVITDLLMPEYDGFYFLEQMQAARTGIPVLIVTSDIQQSTRDKCMALGAIGFLNKPVKKETLLPVVGTILAGGCP